MKAGAEDFAEDGPGVWLSTGRQSRERTVKILQVSEDSYSCSVRLKIFPHLAEAFIGEFGWYRESPSPLYCGAGVFDFYLISEKDF